jgi:hypothetical protein
MGCCGCGCLILVLLVLLLAALIGGSTYLVYDKVTSTTAANIPSMDAGDDVYSQARQKISGFNHDLESHLPASLHLNSDEINTLIARNPDFAATKIQMCVTLTGDQGRLQASVPMAALTQDKVKDRFVNFDTTFGVNLDLDTRSLNLIFKSFQVGSEKAPENDLPLLQSFINPQINQVFLNDAAAKSLINRASAIEIKDGELVIQTK